VERGRAPLFIALFVVIAAVAAIILT